MSIAELVKQGKFVVTAEVGPPKGVDIQEMLETVELMRGRVDAINVTDQQSSAMRLGSLAICHLFCNRSPFCCVMKLTKPKSMITGLGFKGMRG